MFPVAERFHRCDAPRRLQPRTRAEDHKRSPFSDGGDRHSSARRLERRNPRRSLVRSLQDDRAAVFFHLTDPGRAPFAALADTFRDLVLEVDPEKDRQVEDGRWALDASFCFLALGRLRCRANERLVHACVVGCRGSVRRQTKREKRASSRDPKGPNFFHDCPFVNHHALNPVTAAGKPSFS